VIRHEVAKSYIIKALIARIKGFYCESAETYIIATVEAIIGNLNHLSKTATYDCSCDVVPPSL
jgi:hypothetical protein